jgi:diguanylate cyclase (GGDEF)-like protein
VLGVTITKSNLPAIQKLPCEPTVSEFEYYLSQAMSCQGKPVLFSWKCVANADEFLVKLTNQHGSITFWQLHRYDNGTAVSILEHTTNDVLLIHNLIMSACGSADREVNAEGAFTVHGSQRDVSKVAYMSNRGMALISNLNGQIMKGGSRELAGYQSKTATAEIDVDAIMPADEVSETRRVMAALFAQTPMGVLSHPAFLFLLEKEFDRARHSEASLSILVLQVLVYAERPTSKHGTLPMQGCVELIDRINKIKRKTDTVAQFDDGRFALILPDSTKEEAKEFARQLEEAIAKAPLCSGIDSENINVSMGVATAPSEGQCIQSLMVRASAAQCKAKVATAKAPAFKTTRPSLASILRMSACPA